MKGDTRSLDYSAHSATSSNVWRGKKVTVDPSGSSAGWRTPFEAIPCRQIVVSSPNPRDLLRMKMPCMRACAEVRSPSAAMMMMMVMMMTMMMMMVMVMVMLIVILKCIVIAERYSYCYYHSSFYYH